MESAASHQREIIIIRCELSATNLRKIRANRNHFFARLITMDETWLHQEEVETKRQSQQWRLPGEGPAVKALRSPSAGKVLATIFWDEDGVLLVDYLAHGATINAAYYSELLRGPLRNSLWRSDQARFL